MALGGSSESSFWAAQRRRMNARPRGSGEAAAQSEAMMTLEPRDARTGNTASTATNIDRAGEDGQHVLWGVEFVKEVVLAVDQMLQLGGQLLAG